MRKFLMMLTTFILGNLSLMGASWPSPLWPADLDVDIGFGYREDDFTWEIAGPDGIPNVLSKLHWTDLKIAEVKGTFRYTSCTNYVFRFDGDYGHIYAGHNTDSDFLGDDQTLEFSHISSHAGRGFVYDLSAGVGYQFTSTGGRMTITPLLGYANQGQHLHIFRGVQRVIFFDPGPIPGLNSTYKTRWYGPWLGFDFNVRVECNAYLFGGFDWHFYRYRARGHWNLRTDIGDFKHKANGQGYGANLGFCWDCLPCVTLGIVGTYRNYRARTGDDTTPVFVDGLTIDVVTKLKKVHWHSYAVTGLLMWSF